MSHSSPPVDFIAHALESRGYVVLAESLPEVSLKALLEYFTSRASQDFSAAGIGKNESMRHSRAIRTDLTCWIDPGEAASQAYFLWMEQLRTGLNQRLFLGLNNYECHLALYPEGAFYKKHLDAFKGVSHRMLSSVLYLNPDWHPEDGGELVLYAPWDHAHTLEVISPRLGTLVLFLSEDFPHEVKLARKPRQSITGWFRTDGNAALPL